MRTVGPIVGALVSAAALLPAAQSRGVRYGPGVCGPVDATYVKVATETGGQPFPMSPLEVGGSSRIMEASLLPEMILWASGTQLASYSIPIDSTVAKMMVSGTFDGTGGSLNLVAPDGTAVRQGERVEETNLNCGRIITVDAPASGIWQMDVAPTTRFWLSIHAKSSVSLDRAEFVDRDGGSDRFVRIQGEPIGSRPGTLRVSLSPEMKNPAFQLVSLDGRALQGVDLQSADETEFIGTVTLPAEPFRVLVSGSDESGARVQRIWPGLFHGENIEVIPPTGDAVVAGADVPVTFRILNHGGDVRLALVATDQRGRQLAVQPARLDVAAGGEGTATVRLTVPADAQPLARLEVRLTATVEGAVAIGGFNSASKTFGVVRE